MSSFLKTISAVSLGLGLSACSGWGPLQTNLLYSEETTTTPYVVELHQEDIAQYQWYPVSLSVDLLVTQRQSKGDFLDDDLIAYLDKNLPLINTYLAQKLNEDHVAERLDFYSDENTYSLTQPNTTDQLRVIDLPKVHYGDPYRYISNAQFMFPHDVNELHKKLAVIDGTSLWKSKLQTVTPDGTRVIDIRLGIIQVFPVYEGKKFLFDKMVYRFGTSIETERGGKGAHDAPINVVAFKGLAYDQTGTILTAGIEGFLPIYPIQADINLWFDDYYDHLHTSTDELNAFETYPWQKALDHLIDELLTSTSTESEAN